MPNVVTPYKPVSPIGSSEFPMADFSNIGRPPAGMAGGGENFAPGLGFNAPDPNLGLIRERATNPQRVLANGGPFAASITDAGGRVGGNLPSRADLFWKAMKAMMQQNGQGQQQPPTPMNIGAAPQFKTFGDWIADNYPHLANKMVAKSTGMRLQKEWMQSQQAAKQTYDAQIERYKLLLQQQELEQKWQTEQNKRMSNPVEIMKAAAEMAKALGTEPEKAPKTLEEYLARQVEGGSMTYEQAAEAQSKRKRESTRPPAETTPKSVYEMYVGKADKAAKAGDNIGAEYWTERATYEQKRQMDYKAELDKAARDDRESIMDNIVQATKAGDGKAVKQWLNLFEETERMRHPKEVWDQVQKTAQTWSSIAQTFMKAARDPMLDFDENKMRTALGQAFDAMSTAGAALDANKRQESKVNELIGRYGTWENLLDAESRNPTLTEDDLIDVYQAMRKKGIKVPEIDFQAALNNR